MIQLTRSGTALSGSPSELEKLCGDFNRQHYIQLPAFVEPELLRWIQNRIEQARFEPVAHGEIAKELWLKPDPCVDVLHFVVNTPKLYEFLERVCDRRPIRRFSGRVYRMIPGGDHFDSWHDDLGEPGRPRLLAMSVNLGTEPYSGGVLQIRERVSEKIVSEVLNIGPGDAIFFRIDRSLQHRLTDLQGTIHKTAFAGWFLPGPSFHELAQKGPSSGEKHGQDS